MTFFKWLVFFNYINIYTYIYIYIYIYIYDGIKLYKLADLNLILNNTIFLSFTLTFIFKVNFWKRSFFQAVHKWIYSKKNHPVRTFSIQSNGTIRCFSSITFNIQFAIDLENDGHSFRFSRKTCLSGRTTTFAERRWKCTRNVCPNRSSDWAFRKRQSGSTTSERINSWHLLPIVGGVLKTRCDE